MAGLGDWKYRFIKKGFIRVRYPIIKKETKDLSE
jgi:hypothetical protein